MLCLSIDKAGKKEYNELFRDYTKYYKIMAKISTTKMLMLAAVISMAVGVYSASAEEYPGLQLTQTKATLGVGQSINLISVNGKKLKATRSSTVVGVSVTGGNQVSLFGRRVGSATVKLCDDKVGCEYVSVTVQKAKDAKFRVAKTKVSVNAGSSLSVMSYSGNDVVAYSNSSNLVAFTDGPNIALRGIAKGKATVTVCSSNRGCLPIFVTILPSKNKSAAPVVKNIGNYKVKGALPLSQTSLVVEKGQFKDIIGESHSLKVTGEAGIVRTAVNDNRVTVYGQEVGTVTISICDPNALCAPVYVKVTGGQSEFAVSSSKVTVGYGQNIIVKAVGGGNTISAYADNSWLVSVSVKDDAISIYGGYSSGDTTVHICSAANECRAVTVSVRASGASTNTGSSQVRATGSFSSVVMKVGESKDIHGSNLSSSYNVSNNSNSWVVSANMVSMDLLVLRANAEGTSIITLCPTSQYYSCGTVGVTVLGASVDDGIVYDDSAPLSLTKNNVTLTRGQTYDIKASTGNGLTAFSDSTSVRTAVNANRITIYATTVGESTITACAANGSCATVKVKVTL